jgi:hypothetical protein
MLLEGFPRKSTNGYCVLFLPLILRLIALTAERLATQLSEWSDVVFSGLPQAVATCRSLS